MEDKPKKKPNILLRLLAFLLTVALTLGAVALVANREHINFDALRRWFSYRTLAREDTGQAALFSYEGRSGDLSFNLDGDLLICSSNGVQLYSGSGAVHLDLPLRLSSPAVSASGASAVVYDIGGTELRVLSARQEVFSLSLPAEQQLLCAGLSGGGLTVITKEPGYKGVVTVYTPAFQPLMSLRFSSRFITDAVMSADGKTVCVLALGQKEGSFEASLLLYRTDAGETPFFECPLGGGVPLMLRFMGEDFWILGESGLSVVGAAGASSGRYDYGEPFLKGAALAGDGFSALLLGKYRAGTLAKLVTVDRTGAELGSRALDEQILSLDAAGRYVAVLTAARLDIYTRDLTLYATLEGTKGARRAVMRADGTALLLSADTASLYVPD